MTALSKAAVIGSSLLLLAVGLLVARLPAAPAQALSMRPVEYLPHKDQSRVPRVETNGTVVYWEWGNRSQEP